MITPANRAIYRYKLHIRIREDDVVYALTAKRHARRVYRGEVVPGTYVTVPLEYDNIPAIIGALIEMYIERFVLQPWEKAVGD